jgi:hypothetical protein
MNDSTGSCRSNSISQFFLPAVTTSLKQENAFFKATARLDVPPMIRTFILDSIPEYILVFRELFLS